MPLGPLLRAAVATRRAFLGRGLAAAGGLAVVGGVLADSAYGARRPEDLLPARALE